MSSRSRVLSMLLALSCSVGEAQQASTLPAGEGYDVVRTACTQCHGINPFTQLREGPDAWRRQVYDMVLRGAQVQAADIDLVVNYLASHFGIANPVAASTSAVTLPQGMGKAIIEQRCTLCHDLDRAVGTRRTASEWDALIGRMIALGAPISAIDTRTVSAYLKANVGL
jgi:mono/diheme cytochrome c family protein